MSKINFKFAAIQPLDEPKPEQNLAAKIMRLICTNDQSFNAFAQAFLNGQAWDLNPSAFDFNSAIQFLRDIYPEYTNLSGMGDTYQPAQFIEAIRHLQGKTPADKFNDRFIYVLWFSYYFILSKADRVPEFNLWKEMLEDACCLLWLENISVCVKGLAGHQEDDREAFLNRLRPIFAKQAQALQAKTPTCNCMELWG